MGRLAELEEEVQFLREKCVIVARLETEQRISLAEGPPANDNFGTAFRDQVEGRELLKHPHGVGRAQHRDRAGEADRIRAGSRSRQNDRRGGIQEFGAVVLAHAEHVEPDAIGDLDLLEEIGHAIGCRRRFARRRIGEDCRETVDADFHSEPLAQSSAAARDLRRIRRQRDELGLAGDLGEAAAPPVVLGVLDPVLRA